MFSPEWHLNLCDASAVLLRLFIYQANWELQSGAKSLLQMRYFSSKFAYQTIKSGKNAFVLLISPFPPPPQAMLHSCYSCTLRNAISLFWQHCIGAGGVEKHRVCCVSNM